MLLRRGAAGGTLGAAVVLCALLGVARAQWAVPTTENITAVETREELNAVLSRHEIVVLELYGAECFLCAGLHPTFDKVAARLKVADAGMARIFCDGRLELCESIDKVTEYPRLHVYRKGKHLGLLNATHSSEDHFVETVRNLQGPAVGVIHSRDALEAYVRSHPSVYVGVFEDEDEPLLEEFAAVATTMRERAKFVAVFGDHMAGFYRNTDMPYIRLHVRVRSLPPPWAVFSPCVKLTPERAPSTTRKPSTMTPPCPRPT